MANLRALFDYCHSDQTKWPAVETIVQTESAQLVRSIIFVSGSYLRSITSTTVPFWSRSTWNHLNIKTRRMNIHASRERDHK